MTGVLWILVIASLAVMGAGVELHQELVVVAGAVALAAWCILLITLEVRR